MADPHRQPLTPRTAAWLVLRHADHRDATDAEQLSRLRTQHAALTEAIILAEEFVALIRERQAERFDPWLAQARDSVLPASNKFARRDRQRLSCRTGCHDLTVEHRTGGRPDHRLKMIKRQMFGCASFDLLNRRFILVAYHQKWPRITQIVALQSSMNAVGLSFCRAAQNALLVTTRSATSPGLRT